MQPTCATGGRRPGAFVSCVQIATDAQNPHQRVLRIYDRGKSVRLDKPKSHQMSKSNKGEFWTSEGPAANFLTNIAPPKESFAPPEKRKNFVGAKFKCLAKIRAVASK
jgi:hypothetical protein